MKVVTYARVSSIGQVKDGLGLSTQQRLMKEWAKTHGHRIVQVLTDGGKSGALPETERPGLLDALNAIRRGEADGLVVASMDRLARALTVQEAVLGQVWKFGGKIFTVDGGEVLADDLDDPMRTALRQVAGVFAELDRRMTVKRLRDGRATKAAQGGYAGGGPPYGWRAEAGALVAEREEQAVLDRIRALHGQGLSLRAIAATLNADFVPARRGRWHGVTVGRALARIQQRSP